jgi:hypothetical protein
MIHGDHNNICCEELSLEKLHAVLGVIQNLRGVDPELKLDLDNAKTERMYRTPTCMARIYRESILPMLPLSRPI